MGNILQIRNVDPLAGGRVEVSAPAPDLPSQGYTAIVRRGTTKNPFLGPDGWQQVEHAFVALESRTDGDRLLLTFGPDLVDSALRDEDVVELMIPELSVKDVVVWNGITRSVTLSDVERKAAPVTRDVTGGAGTGADQVEQEPEEEIQEPDPDEGAGDPGPEPDPEPVVDPEPEPEPTSSLRWVLVLIPILLLLGAGGWYFFGMEKPVDEEQTQATTEDEGETAAETDTDAETEGEEETAQTEEVAEPEPEPDPEPELSTYEQGLAALEDGQCDVARTLISQAIGEGSGEAALLMAEQQDSVDFEACMTETANDIRALSHYAMACDKGVEGAKEKLDLLEADLKKRSDEGNVTASEVLRVAFPKAREACS